MKQTLVLITLIILIASCGKDEQAPQQNESSITTRLKAHSWVSDSSQRISSGPVQTFYAQEPKGHITFTDSLLINVSGTGPYQDTSLYKLGTNDTMYIISLASREIVDTYVIRTLTDTNLVWGEVFGGYQSTYFYLHAR